MKAMRPRVAIVDMNDIGMPPNEFVIMVSCRNLVNVVIGPNKVLDAMWARTLGSPPLIIKPESPDIFENLLQRTTREVLEKAQKDGIIQRRPPFANLPDAVAYETADDVWAEVEDTAKRQGMVKP